MKKFYSLVVALFLTATASAQVTTQITSPGVIKITYGATGDYSFFDPLSAPTFYVHTFINAADNSTGNVFDDAWSNSNVTMNWDAMANAYIGTINLITKTFTNSNTKVPAGSVVNKVGMVFKDLMNGANRQSADTYTTGPTTLPLLAVSNTATKAKSSVINGQLRTAFKGNLAIEVYEMSGKLIKSFSAVATGNAIDLNVSKTGTYLVKITNGASQEVVKFAK